MTRENPELTSTEPEDLVISRRVRAPRSVLWRAWTDPALLAQWWCPAPWTAEVREFDLRPGGGFHMFMRGPGGETSDNPGCFLEIEPERRLVFTSQLGAAWRPQTPWMGMTARIDLSDEEGDTRYIATVMHPDRASRDRHEAMGFFDGWNTCIDQLERLAQEMHKAV